MTSRRRFLGALASGAAGTALAAGPRPAVAAPHVHHAPLALRAAQQSQGGGQGTADPAPMDQGAYKVTRRPARPGAAPSMSADERDALERRIHCQCSCTLDIFTCRTTDFSCSVSPAMHRDVMSLVAGGHSADEIIAAFEETYGERVLMAPKKEGFNLVGYAMPFAVLLAGGTALTLLLRSWRRRAEVRAGAAVAPLATGAPGAAASFTAPRVPDATPDELARLEAAVRGDDA